MISSTIGAVSVLRSSGLFKVSVPTPSATSVSTRAIVGVWHAVELTMKGRTLSAKFDGEIVHDNFVYHDWMLNMEPAPIRLQKTYRRAW